MKTSSAIVFVLFCACETAVQTAIPEQEIDTVVTEQRIDRTTLARTWDTLRIGSADLWLFIPLSAALGDTSYTTKDIAQIRSALVELGLDADSMWVQVWLRSSNQPFASVRIDSTSIQVDLFHESGILDEIELAKYGRMRVGNWSGSDGTLTIDKVTGKHKYGLWQ